MFFISLFRVSSSCIRFILRTCHIKFVDLQRYSKDTFKRTLSDLVKYEEYVTEVNETKQLRGGKLPARVYQIVIMEPDALSLDDIKQMKESAKGPQAPPPKSQLTEAAKAAEAAKENPRK